MTPFNPINTNFNDPYSNIGAAGTPSSGGLIASINTVAAFAGPVGSVASAISQSISAAVNLIGKGRREADIIVPIQNQFGQLLVNVNNRMGDPAITVPQLQALYKLVADGYVQFDQFTRGQQFTDGRASIQARNTIRPLVDGRDDNGNVVRNDGGTLGNIAKMLADRGATTTGTAGGGVISGNGILVVAGTIGLLAVK